MEFSSNIFSGILIGEIWFDNQWLETHLKIFRKILQLVFFSIFSYDRNQPWSVQIGVGQVIQGMDEGLLDMCVGEKRKLTIPPLWAYGDRGAGKINPICFFFSLYYKSVTFWKLKQPISCLILSLEL